MLLSSEDFLPRSYTHTSLAIFSISAEEYFLSATSITTLVLTAVFLGAAALVSVAFLAGAFLGAAVFLGVAAFLGAASFLAGSDLGATAALGAATALGASAALVSTLASTLVSTGLTSLDATVFLTVAFTFSAMLLSP